MTRRVPLVLTVVATLIVIMPPHARPRVEASPAFDPGNPNDLGCSESLVEKTLSSGASWRLCARIHPLKGLVLEQIEYRPPSDREYSGYKRVLDQVALAQLNVPYDNGQVQYNDITSYGFGDQHLLSQSTTTCNGATIDVPQTFLYDDELITRTIPGICVDEVSTGLAAHSLERGEPDRRFATRGTALEISSLSKIGWYEYQERVTLGDEGAVDIALGATGDVAPGGAGGTFFSPDPAHGWPLGGSTTESGMPTYAASHWHNAVWRVDFGLDGGQTQLVERWRYENTATSPRQPQLTGRSERQERAFHALPDQAGAAPEWYRVVNPDSLNPDGHPRSYEIVNVNAPFGAVPVYAPLITFTNEAPCQEYASANLNAGCPGESVLDYVAQSREQLTDPIGWVNVGFHHIDRDEDQSPMPTHWQRFQLVPRDFFAQSPAMPDERSCINGAGWIDSLAAPCIATNVVRPQITGDLTRLNPGTLITASPGSWNEARTTWSYQFLWFRNGKPIMTSDSTAADGPRYVVSSRDVGAELSVKVTASHPGFPSGTAESLPVRVPRPPVAALPSTVRAKAAPARVKRRPTVRIRVVAGAQVPRGSVVVTSRGRRVGRARLDHGAAILRIRAFARPGRHRLRVRYLGSPTVLPSTTTISVRIARRPF